MWPIGHLTGVPLQRPPDFGDRRSLTDEELALGAAVHRHPRRLQARDQHEQDGHGPLGRMGQSEPPDGVDHRSAERPATGADARRRAPPCADAQRLDDDPVRSLDRLRQLGPLHHARLTGLDAARVLQQRRRDPAVAGLRRDPSRNDSRGACRADHERTRRQRHESVVRLLARPLGRQHARRRDDELQRPRQLDEHSHSRLAAVQQHADQRGVRADGALHPHRPRHDHLPGHVERSRDLDGAVDRRDALATRRQLSDFRVRVPRGQLDDPQLHRDVAPRAREPPGAAR